MTLKAWFALRLPETRLRALYKRYYSLLITVLKDESSDAGRGSVYDTHNRITEFIERRITPEATGRDALEAAVSGLSRQLELFDGVHGDHEDLIMVPPARHLSRRYGFQPDAALGSVGCGRRALRVRVRRASESHPRGRCPAGSRVDALGAAAAL